MARVQELRRAGRPVWEATIKARDEAMVTEPGSIDASAEPSSGRPGDPGRSPSVEGGSPPPGGPADTDFINGIYVGASAEGPERQLHILRRSTALRTCALPLRGLGAGQPATPIDALYIPLAADPKALPVPAEGPGQVEGGGSGPGAAAPVERIPDRGRTGSIDACEALAARRRLVVLGGPGAGKTTLLAFLAWSLASGDRAGLPTWPGDEWSVLPLYLQLRDLAAWAGGAGSGGSPTGAALIWDFLRHDLSERNLSFCQETLEAAVRQGQALFLWDGLDEVPPVVLVRVRLSLLAFHAEVSSCRVVLASRPLSYDLPGLRLPEALFPVVSLRPFDRRRVERFAADWFGELARHGEPPPAQAEGAATAFLEGLEAAHLYRMAGNPLMLTLLALVYTHRHELPEVPAQVYEAAIEVLLRRLDGPAGTAGPRLGDLLRQARRDRCDLVRVYERLAMRVHQLGDSAGTGAGAGPLGRIGEGELLTVLRGLHPGKTSDWAQTLLDLIKHRPGLLREEGPDEYDFLHRSLREYLAGCHLAHTPDFGVRIAGLTRERASWWREPTRHAVGFLVHCQRDWARPIELIERLCPPDLATDDGAWRRVWLAGEVAAELGAARAGESPTGARILERARHRLAALVEAGALGLTERTAVAAVLARLGDPRFHSEGLHLPGHYRGAREHALGLVRIRAGTLVLSAPAERSDALPNESGGEESLTFDYSFWIGRYPVTVAQFRVFLGIGGYERRDWWSDPGWAWRQAQGRGEPQGWAHQAHHPNRPVVGLNWFEAAAYAAWLDAQLRKRHGQLPEGYLMRLPTEAEWALAARGSAGRVYPWGDGFSSEHANCRGGPGCPSTVGLFPRGATPEGVHDLAGNVWEWTGSRDYHYPYDPADGRNDPWTDGARIVRGGSWDSLPTRVRTAARASAPMRETARDIGFRLVLGVAEAMI